MDYLLLFQTSLARFFYIYFGVVVSVLRRRMKVNFQEACRCSHLWETPTNTPTLLKVEALNPKP